MRLRAAVVNRAGRIRKVIPGAPDELITALAAKPAVEVDLIITAMRQARRDERQHQADLKRQAKIDKRNQPGRADDGFKAENYIDSLLMTSVVPRAGRKLEHLARLRQHYADGPEVMALAVAGARAKGWSDTQIGMALGYEKESARQEVGRRYGRKGNAAGCSDDSYTETPESGTAG